MSIPPSSLLLVNFALRFYRVKENPLKIIRYFYLLIWWDAKCDEFSLVRDDAFRTTKFSLTEEKIERDFFNPHLVRRVDDRVTIRYHADMAYASDTLNCSVGVSISENEIALCKFTD